MQRLVPTLAVIAATAGALTTVALRSGRASAAGPDDVEAGVGRCTSDARCSFEDARGRLSPARSTVTSD
jgi:hypothetical protein